MSNVKGDPLSPLCKSLNIEGLSLECEAKADYIVSRDPHLRNLEHFHGVKIDDVKAFVERVRKG